MSCRSLFAVISTSFIIFTLFPWTTAQVVRAQSPSGTVTHAASGRILVKYRDGVQPQKLGWLRQRIKATQVRTFSNIVPNLHVERLPSDVSLAEALSLLRSDPNVEYAEPDYQLKAVETLPDDTFFNYLWGMNNIGQLGGTEGVDIGALKAWDITTGSPEVVVGVIDTGIDYYHLDLAENMWVNPGEVPDNGMDDDENGFIDDVYGWNADAGTGDPLDDHNHGTHVAGIIGAAGNNGEGVTGVNWTVRLMGLKFLDSTGSGFVSAAIECIDYAVEMKRQGVNLSLINASWGGSDFSQALSDSIELANEEGILFLAAAGNNGDGTGTKGLDNDETPFYPASYDLPNIISIAAIDSRGQLAGFSNYGHVSVDLGAPGVLIASTVTFDRYGMLSGSSMATPHVTGVAALALAINPDITADDLKEALLEGAVPLATLEARTVTGGMVNALNTLLLATPSDSPEPGFEIASTIGGVTLRAGESTSFDVQVRSLNGFEGTVTLSATLDPDPGGSTALHWSANPLELTGVTDMTTTLTVTIPYDVPPGSSTLRVEAISGERSRSIVVPLVIEAALPDPSPGGPDDSL